MASSNLKVPKFRETTSEGARVERTTAEQQLKRSILANLLWEDSFYEDGESIALRISRLVPECRPTMVYDLAVAARGEMKLRHTPLKLAAEMLKHPEHKKLVGHLLPDIIQRADELSEFLAIYWKDGKRPIAAQAKKGLAAAFPKFNEYQLAKYNGGDKQIKLRDVLFLSHAKPKDSLQAQVWEKLVKGELPTPDTWEVALTASQGKDKKEVWTRLLTEGKLGALALLRNLRNMKEAGVADNLVKEALMAAKVDQVLPFRFIAAARHNPHLEPTLEGLMLRCLEGSPKLPGKTALVIDTSPSMWMANVSSKSEMTRFEAAAALAILVREICTDVEIYYFNHTAGLVPARRGFALRDALAATKGDWSIGGLAIREANRSGYDRIICLTDGQWHPLDQEDVANGRARQTGFWGQRMFIPSDGKSGSTPLSGKPAYMINISTERNAVGYGPWTQIDGWSEAIVSYIAALEGGAL